MFGKVFHLFGTVVQLAAGGAFTLLGASPKVAAGAFIVGTLLSALGVHVQLPSAPPVTK
ncbi:MAG TPA: hypothetical protein VH208_11820 [Myxococcaceae bacterium]|jgi:hypothetical protein|nr:hypothetical protein [Myxococcaceae bacterium]